MEETGKMEFYVCRQPNSS